MPVSELIFLGAVFFLFTALDVIMVVSLCKPGDERNQIIVWKASSLTLFAAIGTKLIDVVTNFVKARPMTANPFVQLETIAVIYFISLLYYKKRHSG